MSEVEQRLIYELSLLLDKISKSEDKLARLHEFYETHHNEWRADIAAYFLDILARKRDQIEYEWDQVRRMGVQIAENRFPFVDF